MAENETKHLALTVQRGDALTIDGALVRVASGGRVRLDIYAPANVPIRLDRADGRSREL